MTKDNDWKKQFSPEIIKAAEEAVKSGRLIALTDDKSSRLDINCVFDNGRFWLHISAEFDKMNHNFFRT
ncbi:MAG: hypothetical protein J6Y01_05305 [Spirochaetales bacterium]|nr:hypothetical protein [Spirochaetales bacterium]